MTVSQCQKRKSFVEMQERDQILFALQKVCISTPIRTNNHKLSWFCFGVENCNIWIKRMNGNHLFGWIWILSSITKANEMRLYQNIPSVYLLLHTPKFFFFCVVFRKIWFLSSYLKMQSRHWDDRGSHFGQFWRYVVKLQCGRFRVRY